MDRTALEPVRRSPDFDAMVYPFGFLYSEHAPRCLPSTFRSVLPGLQVHPKTSVEVRSSVSQVILIGRAIDSHEPSLSEGQIADRLLQGLEEGEDQLIEYVAQLVGRYCVIYSRSGVTKVLHDAIGMRAVYYAVDGAVLVASHASLVRQQLNDPRAREPWPFFWGYPGYATPYVGVYLLPPNNRLNLQTAALERFFPLSPVPVVSAQEAADYAVKVGTNVLRALVDRAPLALSITAGIDSRVSLALSLPITERITYFTYRASGRFADADVALPLELAERFGLRHLVLNRENTNPNFSPDELRRLKKIRQTNTFGLHSPYLLPWYFQAFSQWTHIHVRSNMFEIGRASFQYKRPFAPDTVESATRFYISWIGAQARPYRDHIAECFQDAFERAHWKDALQFIPAHDLYFWEHRMPAWLSATVLMESDCFFDTIILLNSRNVLARLVGVPVESRLQNAILLELIRQTAAALLEYPFNPETWPQD